MIVIKAIALALVLIASETFANICEGRWNGELLPNPVDCGSFYVCNYGEPKLFQCYDNLLYDPIKRVCNWAYMVPCGQSWSQPPNVNPPQPSIAPPNYPPIYPTSPPDNQPDTPEYTAHPPPIVDVPNTPNYNEVDHFYPGLVEPLPNVFRCTNPEFYFAPHPQNCERYFICENYRIHYHQCGEGIHWDYVYNQCDFANRTFCYAEQYSTATVEITTVASAVTGIGSLIECPLTQAFIAHPNDHHKYYICIGGFPIITSCPDKMAWDEDMSQCNEEAWEEYFG